MKNEVKKYDYINDINEPKRLVVYPLENGAHPCTLWSRRTGELCGGGNLTPDELREWLAHYGLEEE